MQTKAICQALQNKGTERCRSFAVNNGYCGKHDPELRAARDAAPRCCKMVAAKSKTHQCTRRATHGIYCGLHDPDKAEARRQTRERWGVQRDRIAESTDREALEARIRSSIQFLLDNGYSISKVKR